MTACAVASHPAAPANRGFQMLQQDVPMHRYNNALPEVYRSAMQTEHFWQLEALRTLAHSISNCDGFAEAIGENSDFSNTCCSGESYDRCIERDLAAFERGLGRFLDLKYTLQAEDYNLVVSALLRGALTYEIDMGLRSKLARTTVRLIRKRDCVLPDGIPWRPILEMVLRVHLRCVDGGPFVGKDVRESHCRNMLNLLRKTRAFVPPGEDIYVIWSEFGSMIIPAVPDSAFEPLLILAQILPTRGSASLRWLPEALEKFPTLHNSPDWDSIWLALFARVAKHQPCVFDWSPHLPTLYSHIVAAFKLPLGSAAPQSPVERRCPHHLVFLMSDKTITSAATIAVYTQTPRCPSALTHLYRLVTLISNFFHPSNGGRWTSSLGSFLCHFANSLVNRVSAERAASDAILNSRVIGNAHTAPVAPVEDRLSNNLVDEIVKLFLPLVQQGLQSKSLSMSIQAASASRDFAALSPHIVVEPLLAMASECLGSISSPHRTAAALRMLSSLTPVFLDSVLCPTGIDALPEVLTLSLPGIDPNDPSKTEATFRFIAGASAKLQSLVRDEKKASYELLLFLEDYTLQLLERIFSLLDALEAPAKKGRNGSIPSSGGSQLSWFIFSVTMDNLFAAVPLSVVNAAARRVARHISAAASLNALKFYGSLVRSVASAAASGSTSLSSADIFIPALLDDLLAESADTTGHSKLDLASLSEDELVWRLRMLAQVSRVCGTGLKRFMDSIATVISLSFSRPERRVYKAGGRLLRGALEGLTCIRALPEVAQLSDEVPAHIITEAPIHVTWKNPDELDWNCAESLVARFLDEAEYMAHGSTTAESEEGDECSHTVTASRDTLFRVLRMLHAIQRGGRWIMGGAVSSKFSKVNEFFSENLNKHGISSQLRKREALLLLKRPVSAGLGGERINVNGASVAIRLWSRAYRLISDIVSAVMSSRPDDGALLYRCLEPIELSNEPLRRSSVLRLASHACRGYKASYTPIVSLKRAFGSEGGVGRDMPHFVLKLRVEAQHETRLSLAASPGSDCSPLFEKVLRQVSDLAVNEFPRVRSEARGVVTRAWRVADPNIRRHEILRIVEIMSKAAENSRSLHAGGKASGPFLSPRAKSSALASGSDQNGTADFHVEESLHLSRTNSASSTYGQGSLPKDTENEIIIGACAVLRSTASAPLIMREWNLFENVIRALLKAVVAADRPDAAAAVGGLFMKLASLVRPFGLSSVDLIGPDYIPRQIEECFAVHEDTPEIRLERFSAFQHCLLDVLSQPKADAPDNDARPAVNASAAVPPAAELSAVSNNQVHWRLQSLVATVVAVCIREDHPPSDEVGIFFMKSMISDVVSLRHIATKAVCLILALHGSDVVKGSRQMGTDLSSFTNQKKVLSSLESIFTANNFAKQLVHTLALDLDDGMTADGASNGQSVRNYGILNVARYLDGDACWSMIGGRPWPPSWVQRSRDAFNIAQVRLYESLCRIFGANAFNALSNCVQELIAAADSKQEKIIEGVRDDNVRVIAGEVVAGMARGLSTISAGESDIIFEWIRKLLNGMTGPQGAVDGGALIRLVRTSEIGSIGNTLTERLFVHLWSERPLVSSISDGVASHLQARRLRYIHSFIADSMQDDNDIVGKVMDESIGDLTSEEAFGHELKNVREEIARVLSLLAGFSCSVATDPYEASATAVAQRLIEYGRSDSTECMSSEQDELESPKKLRSRQGETLSRWTSVVYWNGDSGKFSKILPDLLPAIVSALDEESDQDRVSHARLALSLAAQGNMDPMTVMRVATSCESISLSNRYRIRGALLPFLQVLSFSMLFVAGDEALDLMLRIAVRLLSDNQLEVRDAAAKTLVPMIRDAPASVIEIIRDELVTNLNKRPVRPLNGMKQNLPTDVLCQRHGATLGLGSMIMANPYDVPHWMPSVLVILADCINDPQPISTSVKRIFADFMRTHRDEWQSHKLAFTEEQLERVSELLVSPSYYA